MGDTGTLLTPYPRLTPWLTRIEAADEATETCSPLLGVVK